MKCFVDFAIFLTRNSAACMSGNNIIRHLKSTVSHLFHYRMASSVPSPVPSSGAPHTKLHGYDFWRSIGSPTRILAPMVDASELAFRMLTRQYGTQLCYSPMIHSRMTVEHPGHLDVAFSTVAEDRPLFAQLCGNDPETVLAAAKKVIAWKTPAERDADSVDDPTSPKYCVDAIDLNLGCPQGIAKRGHYGAFLLEETDTIVKIVRLLHEELPVPVTVKVRILPTWEDTIRTILALQNAGASVITVHGRTRTNMKQSITAVDWDIIKRIKQHPEVRVPIIANGGIASFADVEAGLRATTADGVMSSEGILENPGLFSNQINTVTGMRANVLILAAEYVAAAKKYDADQGMAKGHLLKMLHGILSAHPELRERINPGGAWNFEDMDRVVRIVSDALTSKPALFCNTGIDKSHPGYARLCNLETTWRAQRAASPSIGVCHPAYMIDPREPGGWYMRYRKNYYTSEEERKASESPSLGERLEAFKARRKSTEDDTSGFGDLFGAADDE